MCNTTWDVDRQEEEKEPTTNNLKNEEINPHFQSSAVLTRSEMHVFSNNCQKATLTVSVDPFNLSEVKKCASTTLV